MQKSQKLKQASVQTKKSKWLHAGMTSVMNEQRQLARKKNNDYAFAVDNIGITGKLGLAVRLFDKVCRILSLVSSKKQLVKDESIRDTAIDVANYAVFLVMVLDGKWNKK